MEFRCPFCNLETETLRDERHYCNKCQREVEPDIYEDIRVCSDCGIELSVIMACGVDDYYCEKCGKTVMKENIKIEYRKC